MFLDELEDKHGIEIHREFTQNDKTPATDGFIRINNKEIAVQIKSRESENKKYDIAMKYFDYAKDNLLLFFYCDNISDGQCDSVYYEFFSRLFLENKLRGKTNQGKIRHTFTKRFSIENSKDFLEEFEDEFNNRDANKKAEIDNLLENNNSLKFIGSFEEKSDNFQEVVEFIPNKAVSVDTGLEYFVENVEYKKMYLSSFKNSNCIEYEGENINFESTINAIGDEKIIFKNFEIIYQKKNEKIIVSLNTINRASEIDKVELNFLNKMLNEIEESPQELKNNINSLLEIRRKFNELILRYKELQYLGIREVEHVSEILSAPRKNPNYIIKSLNIIYTFIWMEDKYVLLDSKSQFLIGINKNLGKDEIILRGYMYPFFLLNLDTHNNIFYNQEAFGLESAQLLEIFKEITDNLTRDKVLLITNFVINLIINIDRNIIDNNLIDLMLDLVNQYKEELDMSAIEVLTLFLKSIVDELSFAEKRILHNYMNADESFETKAIILAALKEKELNNLLEELGKYNGKYKELMKFIEMMNF